jgi:hypothetical protein
LVKKAEGKLKLNCSKYQFFSQKRIVRFGGFKCVFGNEAFNPLFTEGIMGGDIQNGILRILNWQKELKKLRIEDF